MTIIEVGGERPPQAIASEGVLLGGDDLTARIMKRLLHYFGEGALLADGRPVPAHIFDMLDSGQNMVELRSQFERLLQEDLSRTAHAIDELLLNSGLRSDQIHAVLRIGGSAEIPAFIELLAERFGAQRIKEINPFTTIVGGLARKGHELSNE